MTINKSIALSFMIALAVMLGACVSYVKHMPEAKRECAICHVLDDKGHPADKGMALVRPSEILCSDCHIDRLKEGEHPTGIAPKSETGLPLDEEGSVTCVTCHEPHGIGGHHAMQRLSSPLLCLSCHNF